MVRIPEALRRRFARGNQVPADPPWDAAYLGNVCWANTRSGVELFQHTSRFEGRWPRHEMPRPEGPLLAAQMDEGRMGRHEGAEVVVLVFERFNHRSAADFLTELESRS